MAEREPGEPREQRPLPERLERFARRLELDGRSPLYVGLLRGAAADCADGGVVALAFAGVPLPPGSVPALRLMAALHYLVLRGDAGELAGFFPSAAGSRPPAQAWPAARALIEQRLEQVRERLRRGVQTNEPGRSAALYGGLLWASERLGSSRLRLLEIGASAGLNLLADRFAYVVGECVLGDAGSPVRFEQPWTGAPVPDPASAAAALQLVERAGCDPQPIDVRASGARELLMSYVWPDEPARLARLEATLALAQQDPPPLERAAASCWLGRKLARAGAAATVVAQSVMWQYLSEGERDAIAEAIARAAAQGPLVWLALEPIRGGGGEFELAASEWPGGRRSLLARCSGHGPPVRWLCG